MLTIHPIHAFNDNFIWLLLKDNLAFVVDPGSADAVEQYLQQHPQIQLKGILITHHHHDHTGGIKQLQQKHDNKLTVYGPDNPNIDGINQPLAITPCSPVSINIAQLNTEASVYAVPGHTLDHIAYVIDGNLFCGDTLFSAGCGRLFEGSAEQMHDALIRFKQLPANTKVYCAHEYTQANVNFALAVDPTNKALNDYDAWVTNQRKNNLNTIPTTIAQQLAINPFLRTDNQTIQQSVARYCKQVLATEVDTFAQLRRWKDNF
ncbi:hydroxyacylglutathione hydrolase [Shewanella maritima]|uniref:hydroxyacylglutathione hydrolase n=1 Tax=Shewanella maritima TaxID=2520507 RepID=UPI0037370670